MQLLLYSLNLRYAAANTWQSEQVYGHRENLVHWQIWDEQAFALAKKHNKLIFVTIGYAGNHCMI